MPNASFVYSATTVTFSRTPQRPDRTLSLRQPVRKTAGSVPVGFGFTVKNDLIRIRLRLTTAERDALLGFWSSTVNGMVRQFTYNDTDGTAHSVRFADSTLDNLAEIAYGEHTADITLRKL